jgi:hypothetical protein
VKNPVLPPTDVVGPPTDVVGPREASSKEKAILAIHPLPSGWASTLLGGAFWLFHVIPWISYNIFKLSCS